MWSLPPIVGEIFNLNCKIIYELKDKKDLVYYKINRFDQYSVKNEPIGPTVLLLKFKQEGVFTIDWYINHLLKYTHKVSITDLTSQLIFVSCDKVEKDVNPSLWGRMVNQIEGKTVIVHLGDQAYMDKVFYSKNTTLQDFGNRYCETWKPHAHLLSNTSNFYLWDDHEIANNIVLDQITDPQIKLIADTAVEAYEVYQQTFHVYPTNIINDYCYFKYLSGDMDSVLLAIERTSRAVQLFEIFNAIQLLDNKQKIKRLILCFSRAVLPIPPLYFVNDKFMEHDEFEALFNFLIEWGKEKQIVVVGGDVHFGLLGKVVSNTTTINVIISSPITNQPTLKPKLTSKLFKNQTFKFNHFDFIVLKTKAKRCYATLNLLDKQLEPQIHFNE